MSRKLQKLKTMSENEKLLSHLQNIKSDYNVVRWEAQRRKLEKSMEKGNYTKYPHIFKADDIVIKQRKEKQKMLDEYEELNSARRKGSAMYNSINGFNLDV